MSIMLCTWRKRSKFKCNGSVLKGISIFYGKNFSRKCNVTSEQYAALLKQFKYRKVKLGGIRNLDKRPHGSLGQWLGDNVIKIAIASYVAPILVNEGYCSRVGNDIKF